MDCREFLEQISNYVDGDASVGLKEAIQEHMAFCHKCEVVYNSTKATLEIVSECRQETYALPQDVSSRLYTKLRERFNKR